ncbi:MAG: hypothetical protein JWM11_6128 [Planctomycetaceae bacterium]|nr:hypothetical protein [Planctomycetaceae bacterium]
MASLSYYGLKEDIREVVRFIQSETDFQIYESYSEFDTEIRRFPTFEDLETGFKLGHDKHGRGIAVNLVLWSPSAMPHLEIQRINLRIPNHTFRYRALGIGLIHWHLGGVHDEDFISATDYRHWSKPLQRHLATGEAETVDWPLLNRFSGRVQRFIQKKYAVAKIQRYPILPDAFTGFQRGLRFDCSMLRFTDDISEIKLLK